MSRLPSDHSERGMRLMILLLFLAALVAGCRQAVGPKAETAPPPNKVLPAVKVALLKDHLPKYLRSVARSAPLLTEENHPHGWQKADCASCHELAETADLSGCRSCHGSNGLASKPDDCQSCHDVISTDGRPDDALHRSHLESPSQEVTCVSCHPDRDTGYAHANGQVDVVLTQGSFVPIGQGVKPDRTCTNSGCHETRTWDVSSCTTCHGYPPDTGLHRAHVTPDGRAHADDGAAQTDMLCESCHAGYDHQSGTVDVAGFERYDASTGTCTASCHLDVTPTAGRQMPKEVDTWDCTSCHDMPPKTGDHLAPQHRALNCADCHAGHTHSDAVVNGARDLSVTPIQVQFAQGGTFQNGTCTQQCHESLDWGNSCGTCHGDPPNTGSHLVHVQDAGMSCNDCHAGRDHDLDRTSGFIDVAGDFTYDALTGSCVTDCHDDGMTTRAPSTEPLRWGCDSCHGDPPEDGAHPAHATPSGRLWDLAKLSERAGLPDVATNGISCGTCHADHRHTAEAAVSPNDFSKRSVQLVAGTFRADNKRCQNACHEPISWETTCTQCHETPPQTGDHEAHANAEGVTCESCHRTIEHAWDITSPPTYVPMDGIVNIAGIDAMTGSCQTRCHVTPDGRRETLRWNCASCHGTPPTSGAHPAHETIKIGCGTCHSDHVHNATAVIEPIRVSAATVTFSVRGEFDKQTKTCTNIGCHRDTRWLSESEHGEQRIRSRATGPR